MAEIINTFVGFGLEIQEEFEIVIRPDGKRGFVVDAKDVHDRVDVRMTAFIKEYQTARAEFDAAYPDIKDNALRYAQDIYADTYLANVVVAAKKMLKVQGHPIFAHFHCTTLNNENEDEEIVKAAAKQRCGRFVVEIQALILLYTWGRNLIRKGTHDWPALAIALELILGLRVGEVTDAIRIDEVTNGPRRTIAEMTFDTLDVPNLEKKGTKESDDDDDESIPLEPYHVYIFPDAYITAATVVQRLKELRNNWTKPMTPKKKKEKINKVLKTSPLFATIRDAYTAHYAAAKAEKPKMHLTFTSHVLRTLYLAAMVKAEPDADAEEEPAGAGAGAPEPDGGAVAAPVAPPTPAAPVAPPTPAAPVAPPTPAAPVAPPTPAAPVAPPTPAAPVAPPTPAAPVAPPTPAAPVPDAAGTAHAHDDEDFGPAVDGDPNEPDAVNRRTLAARAIAAAAAPIADAAGAAATAAPIPAAPAAGAGAGAPDAAGAAGAHDDADLIRSRKRKTPSSSDPREKIFQAIMESDISWADKHAIMSVALAQE
ncbi:hypothetical protein JKP88DRAFT_249336 [Tribonema minus]|uniref:Uncharacterized protein n=1 Tax=Tribonema minus TaxID=303371 RepID=A0A836C8N3_9STRA|nr:hypothetical protein JKP88DRAFT_249336 [Tribonema minus]